MYQNAHLKWKTQFLCIHSLVLEIEGHFYISFDLLKTFQNRFIHLKKKFSKKKSCLPTYPNIFQDVTR